MAFDCACQNKTVLKNKKRKQIERKEENTEEKKPKGLNFKKDVDNVKMRVNQENTRNG